ncbi:aspartate--tRNA ligase [Candidatus Berkelbacteria bacterium]|nr:aspartate--tRNA ligase [Candidatus Berkelbacteria bacterium]
MNRTITSETLKHIDRRITIFGWIHSKRSHGAVTFFDLRDRWGLIQVVLNKETFNAQDLKSESVIQVSGRIVKRPEKLVNPNIATGTIELQAETLKLISQAETPPFELDRSTLDIDEELRLTYRYLDLRSERMTRNLILRHKIVSFLRQFLNERDFIEVETPNLTKGTPEGAREFIVPARLHPGKFYVLPQSPQQYKQLLMVAGIDRYYQLARCFRDEDQRGDRQSEHTQLDIEMAFIDQEDILALIEEMLTALIEKKFPEKKLSKKPWPRLTYREAIEKYQTDKPDLRSNLNDPNELAFAFITDFPLFGVDAKGDITAEHHPFCMPNPNDVSLLDQDPLKVRARAYDMICNGFELASGSIRIHEPNLQKKVLQILKLNDQDIETRFGHILKAFRYGTPPHGGIAPGIDRLTMILADEANIREVMAFPKTGDVREPMTGAPTQLPEKMLEEAHIRVETKNLRT